MSRPLAGKVALITGGARRVGRAIALRLAEEGMDIALTFNSSDSDARQTVEQIQQMGRRAYAIRVDLAQADAADQVHDLFTRRFDRLEALVNNASTFLASPLGDVTPAVFHRQMIVNALTPLLLIQKFTRMLAAGYDQRGPGVSGAGRVVNLVDAHVTGQPLKNFAAYSASKAALVEITRTCAVELAPAITVNAVAPGVVAWNESSTAQYRREYLARVPLGRSGRPEDAAAAVLFLVRDAVYCTGQIIRVDGGRVLA